jgi:hypothetical protein
MGFGEEFRKAYGRGTQYRAFGTADRTRLAGQLPDFFLDLLESDGWASYRDGLLWAIDPRDFEPVMNAWTFPPDFGNLVPIVRTAFGAVYALRTFTTARGTPGLSVVNLDPHIAEYSIVGPVAEKFLTESIAEEDYIKSVFREADARRAAKNVGPIAWNEMYGYEPALALGGSGKPETVRRFNMFNHHLLLSQLGELKARRY